MYNQTMTCNVLPICPENVSGLSYFFSIKTLCILVADPGLEKQNENQPTENQCYEISQRNCQRRQQFPITGFLVTDQQVFRVRLEPIFPIHNFREPCGMVSKTDTDWKPILERVSVKKQCQTKSNFKLM